MKKLTIFSCLAICIIAILSFQNNQQVNTGNNATIDSLAAERKKFTTEVLAAIKGHEPDSASVVFKNVRVFKQTQNIKATHFLAVMNYWGEALGISCTHCHNTNDWASDEKKTKNIARGMYGLRQVINKQISIEVEGLNEIRPMVNCGTCHRGKITPKE